MKSSKMENIFNYQPAMEDSKTLLPLTYCPPLQSSFDQGFSVPQPKSTTWQNPPQAKRWIQGGERSGSSLQMPGGGSLGSLNPWEQASLNPWEQESRGFIPESSANVKTSFPSTSTSVWGELEGRSLCNSTWSNPEPLRPTPSSYMENQSSKYWMSGISGLGTQSQFPQKSDGTVGHLDSRFGGLTGPPYRTDSALVPSTSFEGTLSRSTRYPLMLGSLGKSIGQNVYKPGHSRPMICNFCKNNKEVPDIYLNHYLYDPETKVLSCPVLRKHVCEICGGTGDQAHTLQYCPVNREKGFQSKVPVLLRTRTITNSTGKIRRN